MSGALANDSKRLHLPVHWAGSLPTLVPDGPENTVEFEGPALRTFLDSRGISHGEIMKVDIEGAEQFLLDACAQWAERAPQLMLEIHGNIDPLRAKKAREESGFVVAIGVESKRMELWCVRK